MAGEYGKTGYGYRQAVLTVYSVTEGVEVEVIAEIFFRQPFNRLGLAMSFGFQKTYTSTGPFSDCPVVIHNPSPKIVNSLIGYDFKTYKDRPRVEIRAGYSKVQIQKFSDANKLKTSLPLIYTGYPFEFYDNKIRGGREFSVTLFDGQAVKLYGNAARFFGTFAAGSYLSDIIGALCNAAKIKFEIDDIVGSSTFFSKTQVKNKLFYNGRFVLQDILPALGRSYGFSYSVGPQGSYVFRSMLNTPNLGAFEVVNATNGLIETPSRVSRTHWQIKTLFGLPRMFFPGDWMKVEAPFFERYTGKDNVTGCVIDADYSFDDSVGMCTYTIAPEGEPVTLFPFIRQ